MDVTINLDDVYAPSDNVVAREIQGVAILVPLVAGVADMEEELFTFNETGKAIWGKLDGRRAVKGIVEELLAEYDASEGELEADVMGLVQELVTRKIVIAVHPTQARAV